MTSVTLKQNVANNPIGSYPVGVFKTAGNAELQAVVLVDSTGSEIFPGPAPGDDPLAKYKISDLDEAGSTKYYGNLDKDGNWYILSLTTTAARYVKGTSGYTTAWTNRGSQVYGYFDAVF